jgi:tRNA pseudouridine13 synthase
MKLKSFPEDFVVEELASLNLKEDGEFAVYKLTKVGVESLKLFNQLAHQCQVSVSDIGYLGVKDKHAISVQYISLPKDVFIPKINGCRFEQVGFIDEPLTRGQLEGNKFEIIIRDVNPEELEVFMGKVNSIDFINYFDLQRFGHVLRKEFIAVFMAKDDFENAVKLYLKPNRNTDSKFVRNLKKDVLAQWEDFGSIKVDLPFLASMQKIYLKTGSWKETFEVLPYSLREMFVTSLQSYLWNMSVSMEILAKDVQSKRLSQGVFDLEFDWYLPSKKLTVSNRDLLGIGSDLTNIGYESEILQKYNLTLDQYLSLSNQYRLKNAIRDTKMRVTDFKHSIKPDSENPTLSIISCTFSLPKGCYATMLIKQLFA